MEEREEVVETQEHDGDEVQEEKDESDLRGLFESVMFLSNEPLPITFFVKNFGLDPVHARIIMDSLMDEYESRDGGLKIVEISRGFQFVTNKRYADQIRRVMGYTRKETLSRGMLETLSIVSYKQPISIAEIDELRGVSSRMMVSNLMKKNLVKPVGRKELPGRPLAYGTTDDFLRYFGLNKISDLPKLSEIKELSFTSED
ncbi:MAG TPA: SMC-Scp complex subunit ScpB [Spirochaetota bacterium]|nr:SMC-Scp complex subunit ScpB [Spirochaetota bacterium]HQO03423.1 SMC-Scp complex subunit ScpB [Spirochaetota bacterium]HQP48220.1 SMC-Scp complex subunit ScpB [Spirochaetota bacterium]